MKISETSQSKAFLCDTSKWVSEVTPSWMAEGGLVFPTGGGGEDGRGLSGKNFERRRSIGQNFVTRSVGVFPGGESTDEDIVVVDLRTRDISHNNVKNNRFSPKMETNHERPNPAANVKPAVDKKQTTPKMYEQRATADDEPGGGDARRGHSGDCGRGAFVVVSGRHLGRTAEKTEQRRETGFGASHDGSSVTGRFGHGNHVRKSSGIWPETSFFAFGVLFDEDEGEH
uniref:Uncharacterized protein n=1 Tax=Romanomermis culicivorax TaxID=13658 RepID=A0A915JQW9_ROMCU